MFIYKHTETIKFCEINFVKFSAVYIVVFDVETAPQTAKLAILERQESSFAC